MASEKRLNSIFELQLYKTLSKACLKSDQACQELQIIVQGTIYVDYIQIGPKVMARNLKYCNF